MNHTPPPSPGVTIRQIIHSAILIGVTALITAQVISDDNPPTDDSKTDANTKRMARIVELATPGPGHKRLDPFIGEWDAVSRVWTAPDAPPQESKAKMNYFWLLDNRFLGQEYKGLSKEHPFEGLGCWGYDNAKKKYTSIWLDTLGTMIAIESGTCDETGTIFTMHGRHDDPLTGKPVKTRSITRIIDRKKHIFEMYREGVDGKMAKVLEVTYTRRRK